MDSEILDHKEIEGHQADLTYSNGTSFTNMTRIVAFLFLFIGVAILLSDQVAGVVIGPAMLFGATFVLTSNFGTDICLRTGYIREYHKRFFLKTGKWVPTNLMPDICVIKISKSATRSDMTGSVSTDIDVSKNEIYLMSANHRKRFLVKVSNSAKQAAIEATELAEKMNKNFTLFNPQISKKTQERLKFRR